MTGTRRLNLREDDRVTPLGPTSRRLSVLLVATVAALGGALGLGAPAAHGQCVPEVVGTLDTPYVIADIAAEGGYAYLATLQDGLRVVDISDPAAPVEVGSLAPHPSDADSAVAASGHYVYTGEPNGGSIRAVDVSNPASPVEVGFLSTPSVSVYDISVKGNVVYASGSPGFVVVDASNPLALIQLASLESNWSSRIAVHDDYAVSVGGVSSQVNVFDISDPSQPTKMVTLTEYPGELMDVALASDHAFVVDQNAGSLWVYDMSSPSLPVKVNTVFNGSSCRQIETVGPLAYLGMTTGGSGNALSHLSVLDISNPSSPAEVGALHEDIPGSTTAVHVNGPYVFVGTWEGDGRMTIVRGCHHLSLYGFESGDADDWSSLTNP